MAPLDDFVQRCAFQGGSPQLIDVARCQPDRPKTYVSGLGAGAVFVIIEKAVTVN